MSFSSSSIESLHYITHIDTYIDNLNLLWSICETSVQILMNRICGVMVSVFASSAGDCGFESRSGETKDYEIGMCCFHAKHAVLGRKNKDWLTRNQHNVSEWATCLLADCCLSKLALCKSYIIIIIIISLKINLFSHWYNWVSVRQQSVTHLLK